MGTDSLANVLSDVVVEDCPSCIMVIGRPFRGLTYKIRVPGNCHMCENMRVVFVPRDDIEFGDPDAYEPNEYDIATLVESLDEDYGYEHLDPYLSEH